MFNEYLMQQDATEEHKLHLLDPRLWVETQDLPLERSAYLYWAVFYFLRTDDPLTQGMECARSQAIQVTLSGLRDVIPEQSEDGSFYYDAMWGNYGQRFPECVAGLVVIATTKEATLDLALDSIRSVTPLRMCRLIIPKITTGLRYMGLYNKYTEGPDIQGADSIDSMKKELADWRGSD